MGDTVAQSGVVRRGWLREWGHYLKGTFTQFFANPVIGRELRVRVRFGRSYLLQASYLAFLIMMTMLLYTSLEDTGAGASAFVIQQNLVNFNITLMMILATLIVLIVPGLTASAITLERERRTIDLLLATPLSSRDLLTGKLVGSMAFVVLLLALTLPISAVSVVMGGMTITELLTTYFLMAMSAMVMCALSLAVSSFQKRSFAAIIQSYVVIGAFSLFVGLLSASQIAAFFGGGMSQLYAVSAVLTPWYAPLIANSYFDLWGRQVPVWVVSLIVCSLLTRLILTASARRVGLYDRDVMPSLRRQALVVAGVGGYLAILPVSSLFGAFGAGNTEQLAQFASLFVVFIGTMMMGVALYLIPAHDGSGPAPRPASWFGFRWMFNAHPSGAMPFLILLWLTYLGGVALGLQPVWNQFQAKHTAQVAVYTFYATSLWFLVWGLGRLVYALLPKPNTASVRLVTAAVLIAIALIPLMLIIATGDDPDTLFAQGWVFTPAWAALTGWRNPTVLPDDMGIGLFVIALGMALVGDVMGVSRARRRHFTNHRVQ